MGGKIILATYSEAAKSFVARRGLGKMRHIEVRDLSLQKEVLKGTVKVVKIKGEENPADLLTKFLNNDVIDKRLKDMGLEKVGGSKAKKKEEKKHYHMKSEY